MELHWPDDTSGHQPFISMISLRTPFTWAPLLLLFAAMSLAQTGDVDAQLRAGESALQQGKAEAALAAGDAAVRMAPERWDGYALSGRALSALRRYEPAADALSEAIRRAPQAQQAQLRELRRECLVAESDSREGPAAPAPSSAASAAGGVPAAAPAGIPPAPPPPPVAHSRARSRGVVPLFSPDSPDAAWTDATGLMWARPWYYPASDSGPFDYPEAQALCAQLSLLGQRDWRLPTLQELQRVYAVSSRALRFSPPKFDPDYGLNDALKRDAWPVRDFTVQGDSFNGNRLLIWTSTPGDQTGRHEAVYFGRAYSVDDDQRIGIALHGTHRRMPFHAYALCVRSGQEEQGAR